MKKIIKVYIADTLTLYIISKITSGIVLEKGLESLLLAGAGLALVSFVIKPLVNILLLPLNLITFGLFRWVSSAVVLYLVTLVVPGFKITGFLFNGVSSQWFDIPSISLGGLLAFIAFSFVITVFTSLIHWILK